MHMFVPIYDNIFHKEITKRFVCWVMHTFWEGHRQIFVFCCSKKHMSMCICYMCTTCVLPVLRHGNNSMLTSFYWQLKAHTKSYKYFENVHIKINQRDAFCTNIKKTINVHKQLQKSEKQQNLLEIYKHSLELWWGQVLTATVVWHHTGLSTCHLEGCCPHLESLKSRRWKWAKCAF